MSETDIFPAKLLLFGEYAVLYGGNALSFPLFKFYGSLSFPKENDKNSIKSNIVLQKFFNYLQSQINSIAFLQYFDFSEFKNELDKGIYFRSSIPRSYGLGSSGALCAAIYSRYFHPSKKYDIAETKKHLAVFENHFHKSSSGFDPLVSFLKKSIYLENATKPELIEINPFMKSLNLYLLDSQVLGKTKNSMDNFLMKLNNKAFQNNIFNKFIELTNLCIDKLLEQNSTQFFQYLYELSHLQLEEFSELIPQHIKTLWQHGLKLKEFFLKLCGSGGGGFFTLFSNTDSIPDTLSKKLIKISL